jgi:hypothetical protein
MPVSSWLSHAIKCVRERLGRDTHRVQAVDALCGLAYHHDSRRAEVIRLRPEAFRRPTGIHNRK